LQSSAFLILGSTIKTQSIWISFFQNLEWGEKGTGGEKEVDARGKTYFYFQFTVLFEDEMLSMIYMTMYYKPDTTAQKLGHFKLCFI
jgi:hypothetical protein